jgi:O-antigen/teichoic acid export membrane protein
VLHRAGTQRLGAYQFVVGLVSLLALLDLNLGQAMTRQIVVAKSQPGGNSARLSGTAVTMLLAISFGIAILLTIISPAITSFVPGGGLTSRTIALSSTILVSIFAVSALGGIANAVSRLAVVTAINGANVFLTYIGLALIPWTTSTTDAMVSWSALVSWASVAVMVVCLLRYVPPSWYLPQWSKDAASTLLSFAVPSWWGRAANLLVISGDRTLVGVVLGVAYVPLYLLPTLVMKYFVSGMGIISLVAFPVVTERWQHQDQSDRIKLYSRGTELFLLCCTGPPIIAMFWAGALISFWLGRSYIQPLSEVLFLAAVGTIPTIASMMAFCVSDAAGRPRIGAVARSIQALVGFSAALPLAHAYGVIGVAEAFVGANIVLWIYGAVAVEYGLLKCTPFSLTFRAALRPAIVLGGVVAICGLSRLVTNDSGQVEQAIGLAVSIVGWTCLALVVLIGLRKNGDHPRAASAVPVLTQAIEVER